MNKFGLKRDDLIYPDLSYKIIGSLFNVWNAVGSNHKEGFYQKAAAKDFTDGGLSFKQQLAVKIKYKGITFAIFSVIALTFILFNGVLQSFELLLKYQILGILFFTLSFIFSVVYAFIENSDGKGW